MAGYPLVFVQRGTGTIRGLYDRALSLVPQHSLEAGRLLFERGYYVQSVTYPAVPLNGGLLRVQVNANHTWEAIEGLLQAVGEVSRCVCFVGLEGVA